MPCGFLKFNSFFYAVSEREKSPPIYFGEKMGQSEGFSSNKILGGLYIQANSRGALKRGVLINADIFFVK